MGFLGIDDVKIWAYSLIQQQAQPSIELIDVATSDGQEPIREALASIKGEPNLILVSKSLLQHIYDLLDSEQITPFTATVKSQQVLRDGILGKEAYFQFVAIEYDVDPDFHGINGIPKEIVDSLKGALLGTISAAT